MDQTSFICISSGNYAQNSTIFSIESRNKQCVANSVCAIAFTNLKENRGFLSSSDINKILIEGDDFYLKCRREEDFLSAEEILPSLTFKTGENFLIEQYLITDDTENVVAKIAPKVNSEDIALNILEQRIKKAIFPENLPPLTNSDGFIFTAHNLTVAFWHFNNHFYVFDPHCVNFEKNIDYNNGSAKFFKCKNTISLASLLLQNHARDNSDFEIVRLTIEVLNRPVQESTANISSLEADHYNWPSFSSPSIKKKISIVGTPTSRSPPVDFPPEITCFKPPVDSCKKRVGRPPKRKRGPKTSTEAIEVSTFKKFILDHSEVSEENSSINRVIDKTKIATANRTDKRRIGRPSKKNMDVRKKGKAIVKLWIKLPLPR